MRTTGKDPLAPDLIDGYVVNGLTAPNAWMTEIQSVLIEDADGGREMVVLSHECRRENVPFSTGEPGGVASPLFQTETPQEFLTYTKDGRFHQIGVVDAPTVEFGRQPDASLLPAPNSHDDWASRAVAPWRPIRWLEFDEVLTWLAGQRRSVRHLHLRLDLMVDGRRHELYCPTRYVNFANPACETTRYIQSISGTVLFPGAGTYFPGYLACAVDSGGETRIEGALLHYVDVFQWIARQEPRPEARSILARLSNAVPAHTGIYDLILRPEATVRYFEYL